MLVDFHIIYQAEAHPMDGWMFENGYMQSIQHRTLDQRVEAAEKFTTIAQPKTKVYVDHIDNNARNAYGSSPSRLYAILNGLVVYQGAIGPLFYDIEGFGAWLQQFIERQNISTDSNS